MNIVYKSPAELIPYRKNAKEHDKKQISNVAKSIKKYGFQQPIVVDKNMVIIVGHCRHLAALKLGLEEVPVVVADNLTDEQVKEFRLVDNKSNESDWIMEFLQEEIPLLPGLDDFEFDWKLLQVEELDAVEDDYDGELPEVPKSKLGDIYQLGRHRLMCGSSTDPEQVKQLMGGMQADLLLTDPPYGVDYVGKTKDALKIENDSFQGDDFLHFLADAFDAADAVMKPGAVFYIWHADSNGGIFRNACEMVGWQVRQCLVWVKNSMVMGRQDYQWKHEPCQPAGTMVWTPDGEVPIEQLKDGDEVISYDSVGGAIRGYKIGYKVLTAHRHYNGTLYGICAGMKETWATDNHQFSVRFNPEAANNWCTYLMRRGDWWRVGVTRLYDARGFGLKHRVDQEHADEAWVIDTFASQNDAQVGEQFLACEYGIPYTHWETERVVKDDYNHRTGGQIRWLYSKFDLNAMRLRAHHLLADFGRSYKYPLINAETKRDAFSRRVTAKINACNIIPGLMYVPIAKEHYEGTSTFDWALIDCVDKKEYDDEVYSLAVDKYEHYIADGIVTHNCLYGWKEGAGHLWASDRKQTTVLEFDKPARNDIHPTMKPVKLFDYQMKNNTKGGDIVLDLFGGSGTTIIAAEQNGRCGYCMELDPRYVDAIINRWEEFTGQKAELISEV